jgi:hypothetical protein
MNEFATVAPRRQEIPRDRWSRPLILPTRGDSPIPYTRASGVGKIIDNTAALESWKVRKALVGVAMRPDLAALVSSHARTHDDPASKKVINKAAQEAQEAAGSLARANLGTALHAFAEDIDAGHDVMVPAEYQADIDAYKAATERFRVVGIEEFVVDDDLHVAGTFDRIVELTEPFESKYAGTLAPGTRLVADLKTGRDVVAFGQGSISVQLAIYANSKKYELLNVDTSDGPGVKPKRTGLKVNTHIALCIHLPVGEGRCQIHEVDIVAGYEAARQAMWVKAWQKRKNLFAPVADAVAAASDLERWVAKAQACNTANAVRAVYVAARTAGLDGADLALLEEKCRMLVLAADRGVLGLGA